jgi:hypothetical protein
MPDSNTGWNIIHFFDKNFLMLWIKTCSDDFRVQSLYGGKYTLVEPSWTHTKAQKVVNTFQEDLYAIVDGIVIEDDGNRMHWTWFVF